MALDRALETYLRLGLGAEAERTQERLAGTRASDTELRYSAVAL